ncbi:MAG: hypothetical protein ACYC96_05750 [Fimbriimonadaceae bacterium]
MLERPLHRVEDVEHLDSRHRLGRRGDVDARIGFDHEGAVHRDAHLAQHFASFPTGNRRLAGVDLRQRFA